MFDIGLGWMEMAVIALLALVVIGPKELPRVLRTLGHWMRKVRGLAREFQSGLDEMVREAELEDAKNAIGKTKNFNIKKTIEDTVDPTGELAEEAGNIEKSAREEPKSATETEGGEDARAAAGSSEAAAGEEAGATVFHHPAQVAPPHSLTPPEEPAEEPEVKTAVSGTGDGSQKRA